MGGPDELAHGGHLVVGAPGLELSEDPDHGTRIGQGGGADLDGVGTGQQHADRPETVAHPAHSDDAAVGEGRPAVVDRPQGDAVEGVSRQAPSPGSEHRCPALGIDRKPEEGVGEGERLRPVGEGGRRHRDEVGGVRRELGPKRPPTGGRSRHSLAGRLRRVGEHLAAVLEVRTADVHLYGHHAGRGVGQQLRRRRVVLDPSPPDAHHHARPGRLEGG